MKSLTRILAQSNARLWMAIAVVRLQRDGGTVAEVRDALNARRDRRGRAAYELNDERVAARVRHHAQQLRTYGRIEVEFSPSSPLTLDIP